MRMTQTFVPVLKESPADAEIISHKLALRAGLIRQTAAGIYAWLPLGFRVLKKIEAIVRREQDRAGGAELLMPTVQSADLWQRSGRYDAYGPEMLRFEDRHGRNMLYGPTNEEMLTELFMSAAASYRDLPKMFYHIQWKFRDERRPRFGVMRGREFLMKDAYSFDVDEEGLRRSYDSQFEAYLRTFAALGLKAVPVRAPTGPIGGDLSHEFHVLADTGESAIYYDAALEDISIDDPEAVAKLSATYAMEEEEHEKVADCPVPADRLLKRRGIEVGHIFAFGSKYTNGMGYSVQGRDGEQVHPLMGSYGIGVSRLFGAIIEACHDEAGIVWPRQVAPYQVGIINLRQGDEACDAACEQLYGQLTDAGVEALYDDRNDRGGAKFATMDLIGLPWQLIVGPKGVSAGTIEVKNRATGERADLSPEDALARVAA
ncbi:proline--tRNA ligase [Pacificimonas flava]|uniref:Proline--tRNA ligase n=2 Tax=Pacificimonas TaxID=1960290 RepID=A0A219B7I5_9SPHN|nr:MULTISPECIES: proline--tRNA ligase [Pacificimonas]MBZ6378611.1 proline--tRNA ligase [Pacificimonas aurantium]OWV34113.1 proline--tRNA ligase [Pacificimonas flava]